MIHGENDYRRGATAATKTGAERKCPYPRNSGSWDYWRKGFVDMRRHLVLMRVYEDTKPSVD
jgi:hypothetical protein